jgi:hypothetical protein
MTKQEVDNVINSNIRDNSFQAVKAVTMRTTLLALNAKTEMNIPILPDLVTLPPNIDIPSLGWYNGLQYTWNITTQTWQPAGTGVDSTNWSFNDSFSS